MMMQKMMEQMMSGQGGPGPMGGTNPDINPFAAMGTMGGGGGAGNPFANMPPFPQQQPPPQQQQQQQQQRSAPGFGSRSGAFPL